MSDQVYTVEMAMTDLQKIIDVQKRNDSDERDQDTEHRQADYILTKLLINLGHEKVVSLYRQIHKWYA